MTAQKIQAFTSLPQVDDLRLVRMQPQPQRRQDLSHRRQGVLSLCRAAAQHHTVIGVTHQLTHIHAGKFGVEHMQIDVGQQRGNHASNALGNFCFDVSLTYRRLELLPRRVADNT